MEDKKLNERESIELITAMISRTNERYFGDGNIYLVWGYVTLVVASSVWLLLTLTHNPAWNWLWFLIWIIGGISTPVMARKQQGKYGVKTYSDKLINRIWTVVGISGIACTAACLAFTLIKGINCWSVMLLFALVIIPVIEIAQGVILEEKSFVAGGAIGLSAGIITGCCIAGGVPLYTYWYMPMFILAFVSMMIIPGHVLNYKARNKK